MSKNSNLAAIQQEDSSLQGYVEDVLSEGKAIAHKRAAFGDHLALAVRGWELKCRIADMDAQLKAINQRLLKEIGVGHALVVEGVTRATLTERTLIDIAEPVKLQSLLGPRFEDLVKVNVTYNAEPRLIELACGADEALAEDIRACLAVKASPSVTWRKL